MGYKLLGKTWGKIWGKCWGEKTWGNNILTFMKYTLPLIGVLL